MCIGAAMKLIVVGVGKWGLNIAREAHALGVLGAIVDTNQSALSRAAKALNADVTTYADIALALREYVQASAVVVATPPHAHYAVARLALDAGFDVWVEKPLCEKVEEAKLLIEHAKTHKAILFTDHLMQYNRAHRALLRAVRSGWAGKVNRVRTTRVNFGTVRTVEDVLYSFCPHDISLVLAVLADNMPVSVSATGQSVVTAGIVDYVDVQLVFADGATATLEASWLHYEKERRLVVYGVDGCVIVNESPVHDAPELQGFKWSVRRRDDGSGVDIEKKVADLSQFLLDEEKTAPLQAALECFLDCCQNRKLPPTDGEEGLRVLRVLVAAQRSLESRAPVRIDDVAPAQPLVARGCAENVTQSCVLRLPVRPPSDAKPQKDYFVHPTAIVDKGANIGAKTKIWHFSHVMSNATLGERCNIGQNVYVAGKAILGCNVKVQNGVSIYDGVTVEDDAFLGPHCTFTNVKIPRSHVNRRDEWISTTVGRGATVGANSTIVCGNKLGDYCFVGAGAVVTKSVPAHAMVYGNPARVHGWVSRSGIRLEMMTTLNDGNKMLICPESKERYILHDGEEAFVKRQDDA